MYPGRLDDAAQCSMLWLPCQRKLWGRRESDYSTRKSRPPRPNVDRSSDHRGHRLAVLPKKTPSWKRAQINSPEYKTSFGDLEAAALAARCREQVPSSWCSHRDALLDGPSWDNVKKNKGNPDTKQASPLHVTKPRTKAWSSKGIMHH